MRKATQRERLLAGMVVAANRGGYAGASVSAVIGEAGVSRPTFYEYFSDRDDCFAATAKDVAERLLARVREAVAEGSPERAVQSTVDALISFAAREPAQAQFLMNETMGGGTMALRVRDEGITAIARVVEQAHARPSSETLVPDLPVGVLIGGLYRWLAGRLRRGERALGTHREDLGRWVSSYEQPAGAARWRALKPGRAPARSPFLPAAPMRAPAAIAPGRPRLSAAEVAENHRLRIMFAAAALSEEKGYGASTITDITRLAGIDGRAFYAQFAEKQEAFMAVHEVGFQEVMAVTAGAFFAGESWPERSWEAGRALTQFLESNPTIAHVGFVEAYAVSRAAAQRVEESHSAFTIFLQEGFQYRPQENPPSRAALEAIITTIFELIYLQAKTAGKPKLSGLLGHIMHLWLTPFLGPAESDAFIDAKLKQRARVSG